ncbi:MAG: DUF456 domain-containing protein [Bacillota bacterium]|jgi:uncharacterized protein YqgC (DUF456 family)|nr:DUF456 domain-containing protein [Thermoanaerobacteraceae bacterium]
MATLGLIIAVIFFLAGLAGTVLPVLPAAPLILAGMFVYGLFAGFEGLSVCFFAGQAVAVALTFLVDYLANMWAVSHYGGSRLAIWGGVLGLVFGAFFGPLGVILGPFLGAFAGELLASRRTVHALRVGIGSFVGFFGSTVIKLLIEVAMIVWFFLVIF